jgi:hypothetical protein
MLVVAHQVWNSSQNSVAHDGEDGIDLREPRVGPQTRAPARSLYCGHSWGWVGGDGVRDNKSISVNRSSVHRF